MPGKKKGITHKQKLFCIEYLRDFNATQAYRRAGYSVKSDNAAGVEAYKLLRNPKIQGYIKELQEEQGLRLGISADRVLQEYARVAFVDITQVITWKENEIEIKNSEELPKDITAAIKTVNYTKTVRETERETTTNVRATVQMHDKIKALEMLSRHTGIAHDINWAQAVFRKYGFNVTIDSSGQVHAVPIEAVPVVSEEVSDDDEESGDD